MVAAVLLAVLAATPVTKPPSAPAPNFRTSYRFMSVENVSADGKSSRKVWMATPSRTIEASALPKAVTGIEGQGVVTMALAIDPTGTAGPCTVRNGDASIGRPVCKLLSAPGAMPLSYAEPGKTVAREWLVEFHWTTKASEVSQSSISYDGLSPAPPMPASMRAWPPRFSNPLLIAKDGPPSQALIDASIAASRVKVKGRFGAMAVVKPDNPEPSCRVEQSTGNAELDAVGCGLLKSLRFSYREPCADCATMSKPVRIDFTGRDVRLQLPVADARFVPKLVVRPTFSAKEAGKVQAALGPGWRAFLRVRVLANGRIGACRASIAHLDADLDRKLCKQAASARFLPATDAFGEGVDADTLLPLQFGS